MSVEERLLGTRSAWHAELRAIEAGALEIEEPTEDFYRTYVGGSALGLAYLFIAAMTATSFDRSAAWLGPRR